MRPVTTLGLLLIAGITAVGCDRQSLLPVPEAVAGEWMAEPYRWSDNWSPKRTDQLLTLGADGGYTWEVRSYGGYGKSESELTFFSKVIGEYRVEGDRLQVRLAQQVTWDSFYGNPKPRVEDLSSRGWTDHGTLELKGDRLTHTYISYPADAPETTVVIYQRIR